MGLVKWTPHCHMQPHLMIHFWIDFEQCQFIPYICKRAQSLDGILRLRRNSRYFLPRQLIQCYLPPPHLAKMNLTNQSTWFPRGAELCVNCEWPVWRVVYTVVAWQTKLCIENALAILKGIIFLKNWKSSFSSVHLDGRVDCVFIYTPNVTRSRQCRLFQALLGLHTISASLAWAKKTKNKSSLNYLWPKHKHFNCLPGNKICRQTFIRELSHATSY